MLGKRSCCRSSTGISNSKTSEPIGVNGGKAIGGLYTVIRQVKLFFRNMLTDSAGFSGKQSDLPQS